MSHTKRNCDNCGEEYLADNRNLKRGWGLTCSKSCAASMREKSKPFYNPKRVAINNERRKNWNKGYFHAPIGERVDGFTSEGYYIKDGTAFNEFDEPVYNIDDKSY